MLPRKVVAEGHGQSAGSEQVGGVHDLDVHMRLGGVAGVAAGGDRLPSGDLVAVSYLRRSVTQVGQNHERPVLIEGQDQVIADDGAEAAAKP